MSASGQPSREASASGDERAVTAVRAESESAEGEISKGGAASDCETILPSRTWRDRFRWFSSCTSAAVGSPRTFIIACVLILIWAATGPIFSFSNTWQLVINTGTTIVTFLMVFMIQNTQNRDARAIHLKLDELIRGMEHARNKLVDLENASDEDLDKLQKEFTTLRETANHAKAQTAEQAGAATAAALLASSAAERAAAASAGREP